MKGTFHVTSKPDFGPDLAKVEEQVTSYNISAGLHKHFNCIRFVNDEKYILSTVNCYTLSSRFASKLVEKTRGIVSLSTGWR